MKRKLLSIILLLSIGVTLNAYNYGTLEGNIKGCEDGDAKSCNDLAGAYLTGRFKLKDDDIKAQKFYDKSISLYGKYCDEGDAKACFDLGDKYNGMRWGIDQNYTIMMKYYMKSCKNGYGMACNELGAAYKRGKGLKKDKKMSSIYYDKALVLYDIECNKGVGVSCKELKYIYQIGLYAKEDNIKAVEYLNKAFNVFEKECDTNDAEGCYQLASIYFLKKDYDKTKEIFKKSCKLGVSDACRRAKEIDIGREKGFIPK